MDRKKLKEAGLKIVSGSVYPGLVEKIVNKLGEEFLVETDVGLFPDGEIKVNIYGETLRKAVVFIIHSVRPGSINDDLMELSLLIQAASKASAQEINVLLPYLPYARQDRKVKPRTPISARHVVKNMIDEAGADRLVCVDLHSSQIQGFSDMPIDNLWPEVVFAPYIDERFELSDVVLLSPDEGGLKRCRKVQDKLLMDRGVNVPLAIIEKDREGDIVEIKNILNAGELKNKIAIIIDDIASTCGTLVKVAQEAAHYSPREVYAVCTHGLFVGDALTCLRNSPIQKVVVTNSIIPQVEDELVEVIEMAPHFARVLGKIVVGESVSAAYPQT